MLVVHPQPTKVDIMLFLKQLFSRRSSRYLNSPVVFWLNSFAEWLIAEGYAHLPTQMHVYRLKRTLEQCELISSNRHWKVDEINELFTSCSKSMSRVQQVLYCGTQAAFLRFLESKALLVKTDETRPLEQLVNDYENYLIDFRGFAQSTVSDHLSTISFFLDQIPISSNSLINITINDVESFVSNKSQQVKRQTLQHTVAHLRSFLHFCFERGDLPQRLDSMIDTPRTYRQELPPRALSWNQVLALLRSIDRSDMAGCRDHAMLYLMAYYGLRPSEVAALKLDSIDWSAKLIKVEQRKTNSALILPLSDQARRVLKRYLRCGRPGSRNQRYLFLRNRTPTGPIKHYAVCDVYTKRALQSGLPLQNTSSYCLRHAFAMRLLNQGVGVKAIGDLLGHRTLESTCVYLRLQVEELRNVALPLPIESGRSL